MPRRREQWLSLAEWIVLSLVSQEPAHGFALAALLAAAPPPRAETAHATAAR